MPEVSYIDQQDVLEVDPDTKEMLKSLDMAGITNLQVNILRLGCSRMKRIERLLMNGMDDVIELFVFAFTFTITG